MRVRDCNLTAQHFPVVVKRRELAVKHFPAVVKRNESSGKHSVAAAMQHLVAAS
jgi:hypothetical protein